MSGVGGSQVPAGSGPGSPSGVVRFDKGYVRTVPGILKLAQLLCNLVGFICIKIQVSAWLSPVFYNLLYWFGNIVTCIFLVSYTFHFVEKFERLPWLKIEFFYCSFMSLSYVVTSIFAATIGESVGYAVGFFGLCAIVVYGFDAYLKFKAWKRGLPPQ